MKKQLTEEHRRKIGEANRRRVVKETTKQKISVLNKGRHAGDKNPAKNPSVRQKISQALQGNTHNKGYKQSDETKRKHRVATCERFKRLGISAGVDEGSKECFQFLNMYYDLHIESETYLKEQGYFLDGYDPVTHSVYEYDTKHHSRPYRQKKDLIRQKNIINHYQQIGKPLEAFYRIDATGKGPFPMKNILND